jgi:hypothetical protein
MDKTNLRANYNFLKKLDLSSEVENSLSHHLVKTTRGDETVLISPITSSHSPTFLLNEWDKVFNSSSTYMSKNLTQLEASNRSKFGPRSIAIPWLDRRSSVEAYFSGEKLRSSSLEDELGFKGQVRSRLRPLSVESAGKFLKNDTNSGLPFFTRKRRVKDDFSENYNDLLAYRTRNDPCIMFTRTQEEKKTRNVWGFPIADTLHEMMYYRPLLNYQKRLTWRSALNGPDSTNRTLTRLILRAVNSKQKLVSMDFSSYDSTVKSSLQKASFDYIKDLFQSHYTNELDEIALRFKTIGLVTPGGIYTGEHGVPSGSTFTNEIDSIAQYLIAKSNGLKDDCLDIQGDDGAYLTSDPDLLKDRFESYGLKVNEEKSFVRSDSLVYLQNLYDIKHINNGFIGGIYPTYRALNRIIYPERYTLLSKEEITGSDYFSIRTIAILENCKHHPLHKDLVEFILKYDKYKLNFSENGLSKYIEYISESSGLEGILQNQYSDNLSGLKQFETVKIIRELNHGRHQ